MGLFKKAFIGAIFGVATAAVILFYKPTNFDPREYSLPSPPELKGAYAANNHLRNAQLLLKGQVSGPESLLVEGDTIYTGTWDGKLVKIVNGRIEKTLRLPSAGSGEQPEKCATFDTEPVCGRPLGIRRLNSAELIVVDTYLGIFVVNFDKSAVKKVFSSNQKVNGKLPRFMNDLDVLGDGRTVFFSDSSTRWDRRRFLHAFLEAQPNGRLIQLDLATGKAKLALDALYFANGVQIHPDNTSLLVSECSMARIVRYYFDGPKKGRRELFVENLPGFPDNIRLSASGKSFLVGLAAVRHADDVLPLLDKLGPYPSARKFIAQVVPERFLVPIFTRISKKYGFILELDLDGKSVRSYQDPTGTVVPDVSQASDDASYLYLGSFHSDFIAKVPKKGH